MEPRGRVSQLDGTNSTAFQADYAHENGPLKQGVGDVRIVPGLSVAIDCAVAVDIDVCAAKLKECGCVLVDLLEGVGGPVVDVVGELDVAGYIWQLLTMRSQISQDMG